MNKTTATLAVCLMWFVGYMGSSLLVPTKLYAQQHPLPKLESAIELVYGDWRVDPSSLSQIVDPRLADALAETYTDQVLRTYADKAGRRVMLSISYGDNQRRSKLHLPRGCYEGQGYPVISERLRNVVVRGRGFPIREMVARRGPSQKEYVSYWVVYGNQLATDKLGSRWELFSQQINGVIPDGILFRVSSIGDDDAQFSVNIEFLQILFQQEKDSFFERLIPERA